jgi:hypothetical protein
MGLFIRDLKSDTYLSAVGSWTRLLMEAQDFGEPEFAIAAGRREGRDHLEILATLDNGYSLFGLPLREADQMRWPRPELAYGGQDPG